MKKAELTSLIRTQGSFLCVGLDPDLDRMPEKARAEKAPLFSFCRQVVDATYECAVAYKPNLAFFERHGAHGMEQFAQLSEYLPKDRFNIADAKRGDIGPTAAHYAEAYFDAYGYDAMTINPLMGEDCIAPFLKHHEKWAVVLALTSNEGAQDFLMQRMSGWRLYQRIVLATQRLGTSHNTMFVVGATNDVASMADLRNLAPEHFMLVPGIGAQGGSLQDVAQAMMNKDVGLLVNASRSILYAGEGKDWLKATALEANRVANEMKAILEHSVVLQ